MTDTTAKTFGIADAAQLEGLTGLEFVQRLADGTLPMNPMAGTLGYDIVEVERGRVVGRARARESLLNPWGTVHGGLAATLLDSCMGLAVHSMLDRGTASTTLEFKISFLRPVTLDTGWVRAEGTALSQGRRAGFAEGRLTDDAGRLLAHATTTCLVFEAARKS